MLPSATTSLPHPGGRSTAVPQFASHGAIMIVRICHTTVRAGKAAAWQENVRRMSIPTARASRGVLAVYAGSPIDPPGGEFVLVTVWEDAESLRAYTGDELRRVMLAEEERPLVDSCRVEVYEHRDDVI
jgi:quinol monooxygenase YgiN